MKVSLVVMSAGKASGQGIPIALPQFVIGRDPQCNLRPASPLISKKHCAVKIRQGKVYIEDYGSTNGTFLNDQPVKGEVAMKNGDTLKAGPLTFRISIEGQPAANLTPTGKAAPTASAPMPVEPTAAADETSDAKPSTKASPAPAKSAPSKQLATAASAPVSDDDLAAMMLGSADESDSTSFDDSQIPGGSTIMDMAIPPELAAAAAASETKPETPVKSPTPPPENKAPEAKKPEPKKNDAGTAQSAAKALLEKMYRRGRPGS